MSYPGGVPPVAPPQAGGPGLRMEAIGEAFTLFKQQASTWVVATLIVLIINGAIGGIAAKVSPALSSIGGIVGFVLMGGMMRMALKQLRGEAIAAGDVFNVGDVAVPLAIAGLVTSIIQGIGFFLLVIPGFIAVGLLLFVSPLIMDRRMDPMDAIKLSVETLKPQLVSAAVFAFVVGLVIFAGAIPCGLGLFVTFPIAVLAIAINYRSHFPAQA